MDLSPADIHPLVVLVGLLIKIKSEKTYQCKHSVHKRCLY